MDTTTPPPVLPATVPTAKLQQPRSPARARGIGSECLPCAGGWAAIWVTLLAAAAAAHAAPATLERLGDALIDARGMTLASDAPYGFMIHGGVSGNEVVASSKGWQYSAYYVRNPTPGAPYHVAVARRSVGPDPTRAGAWEVVDLRDATFTRGLSNGVPWDSHNVVSLGIDESSGTLHLAWDIHNHRLNYRATKPRTVAAAPPAWTATLFTTITSTLGGENVTGAAYPNFVQNPSGGLDFFHRVGGSGNGSWVRRHYADSPAGWQPGFQFDDGRSGTYAPLGSTRRNAYPNGFSYGADGRLHTTFVWREPTTMGGDGTNHDLCYSYSDDGGDTWRNNRGDVIASRAAGTRITVNSPGLVVWPIPQGSGLMNTQGQAVDSRGGVHALMWHRDSAAAAESIPTFDPVASATFHYWRDAEGNWRRGRVPVPPTWARPRLYFDAADNALAVFGGGSLQIFAASKASRWSDWERVYDEAGWASDAVADRRLLSENGLLSLVMQRPPGSSAAASEIRSIDFAPSFAAPLLTSLAGAGGRWEAAQWDGGLPDARHAVRVGGGRLALRDHASPAVGVSALEIGGEQGSGRLDVSGGSLVVDHDLVLGTAAAGGGRLTLAGGLLTAGRLIVGGLSADERGGGVGVVEMSGGTLTVGDLQVGSGSRAASSGSVLRIAGGEARVTGDVLLGDCGNEAILELTGGGLTVSGDIVPGPNTAPLGRVILGGGRLDLTGNALRADVLALGPGVLQNAGRVSVRELVLGRTGDGPAPGSGDLAGLAGGAGGWRITGPALAGAVSLVVEGHATIEAADALADLRLVVVAGGTGQVAPGITSGVAGLDLAGGGLVDLTGGGLAIAGGMTAAELVAEILAGRGDGSWTGSSGITSTTAATEVASGIPRAVGWMDNGDGSLSTAYAAPGDTNIDWQVDILDASNFLAGGKFDTGSPAVWFEGDFSYDGVVDILDAADLFATGLYDAGSYDTAPAASGGIAAVPEPAPLGLAMLAMLAALAMPLVPVARRHCRGPLHPGPRSTRPLPPSRKDPP